VNGFPVGHFATGLVVSAIAVVVMMLLTWLIALKVGRFDVVDSAWGLGFVVVAIVTFTWSSGAWSAEGGNDARRVLVLVLTAIWGIRLAVHIALRARGKGEDPRYAAMFAKSKYSPAVHALVFVYLTQAAVLWFISFPVQVAMYEPAGLGWIAGLGIAVWTVGFCFEAVGDRQLQRFRDDPSSAGQVMDRGLWRYTRHPNYFGDACVWWGLYLIAAQTVPGALTILSPAVMTFTLAKGTGKPLLERSMAKRRPGYTAYVERTSGFIPWPPKAADPTD
jgi:steroid 5-alpha reductase family enzyme